MWFSTDYRRIFMDMHLNDTNDEYLSKLDVDNFIEHLKNAKVSSVVVKAHSHVGLNYWDCSIGRMHKTLKNRKIDYVKEMTEKCHKNGIKVIVYFSQIYDNYAYEKHIDWRLTKEDGSTSYDSTTENKYRYGLVCPNNPDYRKYCRDILTELITKYKFEGLFLDMPFWPFPCYCKHCQEKYLKETGEKIPSLKNHTEEEWKRFIHIRQKWMQEFILENSAVVKELNSDISIEHNMAAIGENWGPANVEMNTLACDYAGGDYYGGYLQQSFMCKYYNNITQNKPFSYITSRCDKNLYSHTVSRTKDDLLIHCVNALFHNGAFSICDALNPDGTFTESLYETSIKEVFSSTMPLEKYVSGDLNTDVSVFYSTNCKLNEDYISGPMSIARILKEHNIAFDVVGSFNLKSLKSKVLCLSGVYEFTNNEIEDIKKFAECGGSVLMFGSCEQNSKLLKIAGINIIKQSDYTYSYIEPKNEFLNYMKTFNKQSPYPVENSAYEAKVIGENVKVLANITYPYTKRSERDFSAIHSDPPGIHTSLPAITCTSVGKGKFMWVASPMEKSKAYYCRQSIADIIKYLMGDKKPVFCSNAPDFVEIISWKKGGEEFIGVVNQQEVTPVYPINDIKITIPKVYKNISDVSGNVFAKIENTNNGSIITIDKLPVFCLLKLEK